MVRRRPASDDQCWRLRYPISGSAAAGTAVTIRGPHPFDPDELDIMIGGQLFTVPPYYLDPPASITWQRTA